MSFRDFLDKMDEQKQVLHVKEQVSTRFEISHMMEKLDDEGPLLLFARARCVTVESLYTSLSTPGQLT